MEEPAQLTEALTRVLRSARADAGLRVTSLEPLSSGASRRSFRVGVSGRDGEDELILQCAVKAAETAAATPLDGPLSMPLQAELMRACAAAGVAAPPVVAAGEGDELGAEYIVTRLLPGEALPPRLLREERWARGVRALSADAARALATIHRLTPPDGLPVFDQLQRYRDRLDLMAEPRPLLELAYRWLQANRPEPTSPSVVHGDFRMGNLLVDEDGLRAVLDWELAHVGDPYEDIAWASIRPWRFDRHRPAGAFPELEPWLQAYEAAAGQALDRERVRWWRVMGSWTWAVMSGMQARRHLDGIAASVEHAVIGRRVCESEWDLLELLPEADGSPGRLPDPGPAVVPIDLPSAIRGVLADGDLHGRPTAVELVDAVAGFLRDVVFPGADPAWRHQVRIAAHALDQVNRELVLGPEQEQAHRIRLAELGARTDTELAAAIRRGDFDGPAEQGRLRQRLAEDVRDRLLVANPGWMRLPPIT